MDSEYEVSVRLMLWGDDVDIPGVISKLSLDKKIALRALNRADPRRESSKVKTAIIEYSCDLQFPDLRRHPDKQLAFFEERLSKLNDSELADLKVEHAELQMFIYHQEWKPGKSEFYISEGLQAALLKQAIRLCFVILP